MNRRTTAVAIIMAAFFVLDIEGCTDPVRSAQIEALGPDKEPPNPDHRPGQPCLVCHSAGGPSSNKPFAMAGTVYKNNKDSEGAEGISVQFVDAKNRGPAFIPQTGPTGNFYVPLQDWPNIAFPVRVALYDDPDKEPIAPMQSLIGREGSCNYCHRPFGGDDDSDVDPRTSVGQIFVPPK